MMKYGRQSLKRLMKTHAPFQGMFSQINPQYKDGSLVFPFYGHEDSAFILAMKRIALFGLSEESTAEELIKKFAKLNKKDQIHIAYELSHELKIASLAASIALSNQNSNVYEIGPYLGFSSLHYSRCVRNKGKSPSKPIYKLTAIEINKEAFESARTLLERTNKDFIAEVEYVHADAKTYLAHSCKYNDIVFGSLVQPDVCNTILTLSHSKKINFIISYGETFDFQTFENSIDKKAYDIYPFKDREYNVHANVWQKRYGVVALVKNTEKTID